MTETISPTGLETILQEIVETPYHSVNSKCDCHYINPKVHRLIL